jgi:sterol desaturase/sphingolipid hydroxylase (fatty acid hydroxylase superfamily)
MAPLIFARLLVVGWLMWTLTQYFLHRVVFHYIGPRPWQRRFHFVAHGVHHDFPQDAGRLLMPLGVSIPLGLFFFLVADLLLERTTALAVLIGFGVGYLLYDGIHYATHHLKARTRVGKYLKKFHMVHHHAGVEGLWGVSQPIWDFVFGSYQDLNQRPKKDASKKTGERQKSSAAMPSA